MKQPMDEILGIKMAIEILKKRIEEESNETVLTGLKESVKILEIRLQEKVERAKKLEKENITYTNFLGKPSELDKKGRGRRW